jgi:cytochrome d ubiquinol oxidase subunit II
VTVANAVMVTLFVGLSAYSVLGGADFGAGFWDLVAGNAETGREQRELIEHSIGPVWEANHVWLIFALVVLWTGFPRAFAPIMATLYVPLTFAAVGIILRGSAFAFRKAVTTTTLQRAFGATFALSSMITPFFLGAVVGGVATGRVPPGNNAGDVIISWVNPTSMLGGVLAVLACAYLAATFLAADAARGGSTELANQFRVRALAAGVAAGTAAFAGIFVLHADAPNLFHGLTHRALVLVLLSAVAGVIALGLLRTRRFATARLVSVLAVVAVLWGWAVAQYPYLLEDRLRIRDAAGAHATLVAMLVCIALGAALLVPSLVVLFVLAQHGELPGEELPGGKAPDEGVPGGESPGE